MATVKLVECDTPQDAKLVASVLNRPVNVAIGDKAFRVMPSGEMVDMTEAVLRVSQILNGKKVRKPK